MAPAALQAYRLHEAATVKFPYLLITVALIALAAVIAIYPLPQISTASDTGDSDELNSRMAISVWKQRHLVLGVLGIFVYVGAEVAIGSFLVNYFSQPDIGAMTEKTAAVYVSFYWGFAMIGRFIGSAVLQKIQANRLLGAVAIAAFALVTVSMLTFGHLAM